MYESTAVGLYDRCPAPDFAPVLRFVESVAPSPGRVFDVGCGTGSLLRLLHDRGWAVEGCDPSVAMVQAARTKNPYARISVAGCSDFLPAVAPDLITSTFDVVNHLPSLRSIRDFLYRARRALPRGGVLVFDAVTPDDIDRNWSRYVDVDRLADTVLVRSGKRLGPARGLLLYEYFVRQGRDTCRMHVERHILRSASRQWFSKNLRDAGFSKLNFVDAASLLPPGRRSVRWLIAATATGSVPNPVGRWIR